MTIIIVQRRVLRSCDDTSVCSYFNPCFRHLLRPFRHGSRPPRASKNALNRINPLVLVASHAATSSRRELCFCRAFRLGGDTLCFELARRPERPRHQPRASLKAAREMNRLGLVLMQAVAAGPSKWRKTFNIVSFNSTVTHTGSLHTPAVATIQQTSPHVHSTTAVGTKGQGRGLPPRRELAAQDLTLGAFSERRLTEQRKKEVKGSPDAASSVIGQNSERSSAPTS